MLDKALEDAIKVVASEEGQPETVALRLIAFLKRMSEGELANKDSENLLLQVCNVLHLEDNNAD